MFLDVSMKEYEDKAVFLALNPPKLHALRNKLKAVRFTCPLFDTARWVKKTLNGRYFIIVLTSTLNLYILMEPIAGEEFGEMLLQDVEYSLLWKSTTQLQGHRR